MACNSDIVHNSVHNGGGGGGVSLSWSATIFSCQGLQQRFSSKTCCNDLICTRYFCAAGRCRWYVGVTLKGGNYWVTNLCINFPTILAYDEDTKVQSNIQKQPPTSSGLSSVKMGNWKLGASVSDGMGLYSCIWCEKRPHHYYGC